MRIINSGKSKLENMFPEDMISPESIVQQQAFVEKPPYSGCNWYETKYTTDYSTTTNYVFSRKMTFHLVYLLSESEEKEIYDEINRIAKSCTGSDYEKLYKLYSYVCDNISYDHSGISVAITQSGVMTMKRKQGICTGYAQLFAELCYAAGFECYEVGGHNKEKANTAHSWNVVKYNGKWYFCDPTSDTTYTYLFFLRGQDWWESFLCDGYGYTVEEYDTYFIFFGREHIRLNSLSR